jgi:hypothetical protein
MHRNTLFPTRLRYIIKAYNRFQCILLFQAGLPESLLLKVKPAIGIHFGMDA